MNTWTTRHTRHAEQDEQRLYDHFLRLVQSELPSDLVQRFRLLFIDGTDYPDVEVSAALERFAANKSTDQEFRFVLNRCCHILINRWQARPQYQTYIPELIEVFESLPGRPIREHAKSRAARRLRELVKDFVDSDQYLALRRLAQVTSQNTEANPFGVPLGKLIHRYPYLYEHCLVAEGSTLEQQQTIRHLKARAERQYELDLSQFVTYQVRRSQMSRSNLPDVASRVLQPAKNPTLLSDEALCIAVKHFAGKSQGSDTYRDSAQRFLTHSSQTPSFHSFKDDLYQYITASVDPEYGNRQFNNQLYAQLNATLPESNVHRVNDFLIVRTCSQLLNFLVVESSQKPSHFVFVDLLSNLGPAIATGLLLKIALICRKVKPNLEKRFSILFSHYESSKQENVQWLVQAMEHLNLALSTNFSTLDLSFINQWSF
ncbi:hypothetical protein JOY44_14525 [Phormidium sp. CLA17]|uniref:hypothetical protein n=1 Tax=Leptolyngbya sp. Cla-17 TaxID=2803751 RepID=UPI001492D8B9|nr:hypothetical protein [Leptolyngbya sp. Cla-17]MBM0742808.1 hypothetical protein [Leptolyngbya sp. Cla-17]